MTYSEIVEDINFFCSTTTATYSAANVVRNVNNWYKKCISWILEADNRWQFDDSNNTDLPIATTDLVSGQDNYSFGSDWLKVLRIDVKDSAGAWITLSPIDQSDIIGAYDSFEDTDGTPKYFDTVGGSIILKPATSYASADGLKVFFQRSGDDFTVSDTTKTPGFSANFHRVISLGASYDWAIVNNPSKATTLRSEIEQLKTELQTFYGERAKYEKTQLTPKTENYE